MIYTILEGINTSVKKFSKEKSSLRVSNKLPFHYRRLVPKAIKLNQIHELTFPEKITFCASVHYRFYIIHNKKW